MRPFGPALAGAILIAIAFGPSAPALARVPVVISVGDPHPGSLLFGPGNMLCDMHMCRLFGLAAGSGAPTGGIVEFGLPQPDGQARIDMRRCLEMCRASVLGYRAERTSAQTMRGVAIFIVPVELRVE